MSTNPFPNVHLSFKEHKLLASRPAEGTGLHQWLFRAVCALKRRSDDEIESILIAATKDCRRDTHREIDDAIRSVRGKQHRPGAPPRYGPPEPRWPERDDALIRKALTSGVRQADLLTRSPYPMHREPALSVPQLLHHLFPDDPLICIGWSKGNFNTMHLSKWCKCNFRGMPPQFIVPNPMSELRGLTQDGKLSAKSNNNTGARRFLVVEFDFKPDESPADAALLNFGNQFGLTTTLDLCAALLSELAKYAPLVLVVWSGGKSLQGWYPVRGADEKIVEQFFRHARILGADKATWTLSQFVRVPLGVREGGNVQSVIYFNPQLRVI